MANINEKKGVSITAPFKLFSENPVDARTVVADLSELQSIINNNAAYEGLTVYVTSEKKTYTCKKENEIFVFKNSIVEKENEKSVIESEPDITEEMLGSNRTNYWAKGFVDPNYPEVTNLINPDSAIVSTELITASNTSGYVLSPIIKLDFNNFDSYTLHYLSSDNRNIRHVNIIIDSGDGNYNKLAVYYGSTATTTHIINAFKTILPEDASTSQFYYANKIVLTLENIKKLNSYCLEDPNIKDKTQIIKITDENKVFYLAFTSSCIASDDGRLQVASRWSLERFKAGKEHSHTEFNITGLALKDTENRFKNKLLEDVAYELADNDKLLNITDRKEEIIEIPETNTDCKLNTTDSFYSSSWDYPPLFSKFSGNERTDYLISTSNFTENSYTGGYLALPVLILNFEDENSYFILKSISSVYYIRHLAIYDADGEPLARFWDTIDINEALKYAINDSVVSRTYFSTNGKLTPEILYKLCEWSFTNGKSTVEPDANNRFYYVYLTTALARSEGTSSNEIDLENGKHAWSLYYVVPASSVTELSFRLPNLAIDNSKKYFDNANLDRVMNQVGQFVKTASPENIQEINETNTYNLYEEDPDTEDKYVNNGNYPSFVSYEGYCCTKLIEIDPTKTYTHSYFRHAALYNEQKVVLAYFIYVEAGTYGPDFWAQYPGVKYICISNIGANRTGIFSYKETTTHYSFELPNLRLVESNGGGSGSLSNTITLKNIDRVGVIGDSYTESHYTIKDKSWLSKVSLFSDFNLENFAISGDTFRGQLNKIRTGYNRYFSIDPEKKYSWEAMHPSYAMLTCRTNDIKYMDEDQFMNDLMGVLETTRNMGAIPILTTEYHVAGNPAIVAYYKYLADKYGGYYIDLNNETLETRGNDYAPFWGGSHPGTRTNELMAHPCIKFFNTEMPRPYQSIKIFRVRQEPSEIDDLIYGNIYERAEKFKEISISHSALNEPKYYDNCTSRSNSPVQSEYLKLMNGVSITFDKYALIDVIFPATSNTINQIQLNTNSLTGVDCYILDPIAEPYPNPKFYRRFDIPSVLSIGTDIAIGNKYTSSLHDTTQFTVEEIKFEQVESDAGLVNGTLVICSGNRTSTATDGGILTKVSGTGSETLNFYYSATALSSDYPVGKQPIGHWKKLETFGLVTESDVKRCMQVDKMSFLLVSENSFNLNKLEVSYVGTPSKSKDTILRNRYIKYPEYKNELTITNTTSSMPEAIEPADKCKPGISKNNNVYLLDTEHTFTYTVTGLKDLSKYGPIKYKVRVIARYFPDIFDGDTGTFGEGTSPVSLNSFDYVKLKMRLRYTSTVTKYVTFEQYVGMHWQYIDFDILSAPTYDTAYIEFFVEDKPIQFSTVVAFLEAI